WRVERDGQQMTVAGPDPMPAQVSGVAPGSAAADAGLRAGDVVTAINGQPVTRFTQMRDAVEATKGEPLALEIWRAGSAPLQVTLRPKLSDLPAEAGGYEQRWLIGVTGGNSFFSPEMRRAGPVEALGLGVAQTWGIIVSSLTGMWAMISGQIGSCNLGGAISIAESTGQAASAGGANFLWWIAVLSAAIGFLNLLPIPVLDGGHLVFYAYEAVRGRPPSDRALNLLTTIGMALVLGLMIFGLTNDLFCP
ncbi:MAG: RIP metalloprotease, partial [Paracoccus sp. (in: a-proteobacteria)]|nr:RIP metalloprotease [Paracoccus sp. (in: a-proteobacteria)]